MNTETNTKKGFSLIEIMVSLAIFSIVVVVAAGALLKIIDANKKSQAMKSVINNLSYSLESMSREIRMGTDYRCNNSLTTPDCENGGNSFSFEAPGGKQGDDSDQYVYRYNSTKKQLEKSIEGGSSTADFFPVTSADVVIDNVAFYVTGNSSDVEPQKVRIKISGYVQSKQRLRSDFALQTTVSQRTR